MESFTSTTHSTSPHPAMMHSSSSNTSALIAEWMASLSASNEPGSSLPNGSEAAAAHPHLTNLTSQGLEYQFQDPYQSMIECLFILTSVLALFFNASAIYLILSHFRRQRGKRSRITLSTHHTFHHSPSHKLPTAVSTTTLSASAVTVGALKGPSAGSATSHRKVRSGSSQLRIYLLNLFVNDILIALFTTPFTYTDFMYGQWIYPAFLCPITSFISTCAVSVSIYTLIAIGLERYFAIICPFKKLVPFERHTKWIIALIWTIGISLGIPALIQNRAIPLEQLRNAEQNEAPVLDCREQWEGELGGKIYTSILFAATFLVPFTALTYLYVSIAVKTFRHVIPGNADASRDQLQLRNKIRMIKMLIFLVITFAVCWLPIQTFNLVMWTCDRCRASFDTPFLLSLYVIISLACQWLSVAHSLLDPIIYCFNSRNFKLSELCEELGSIGKVLICCCLGRKSYQAREQPHHHPTSLHSTASFSETDCTNVSTLAMGGRRLSRTSISSSVPSSGRNSMAIHASPAYSQHRSLSTLLPPNSPGYGGQNCSNNSIGPRHHSLSSSGGALRVQFRASFETRQSRSDQIKEEENSAHEIDSELAVFGSLTLPPDNASLPHKCSNSPHHAHISRLHSLPATNSITSTPNHSFQCAAAVANNHNTVLNHSSLSISQAQQSNHNHNNHNNVIKRSNNTFLSLVSRLVTRRPKSNAKVPNFALIPQDRGAENGQPTNNNNWPDVVNI